jgi:hypothetical protein
MAPRLAAVKEYRMSSRRLDPGRRVERRKVGDRRMGERRRSHVPVPAPRAPRSRWFAAFRDALAKTLVPPPRLSPSARQQVVGLVAKMKADASALTSLMAESWLAVERVARAEGRFDGDAMVAAFNPPFPASLPQKEERAQNLLNASLRREREQASELVSLRKRVIEFQKRAPREGAPGSGD